ncbi:F-box protein [Senna tora]|uniref:F-box protein n=1 Tax=Senna tora TaxID=362788 RepID=A0A834U2S2_9FABA|nr:F-box protein [Senna tora]
MRYRISYLMDEIWERAVETALDGETDHASARTLTLDGAVKCVQGRLPPPSLLERFQNLQHLSIANIGVSSLEQFPRLRNLQKLILSDNRIAGGLEFLVQAGLDSLRDLDLSNNRIQYIEDLAPLAQLKLVSLDLYECPVTRVKDYRSRVFGLIKSLKYLDKMDAEENERPESDDEDEEDEEEEDDPGSGEIDGEDRPFGMTNGHSEGVDGVVDADEDEESDADEEETETSRRANGLSHQANEPESTGRLTSTEGEIDGHEQGEDVGDEDDNGETGEDEVGVEDDGEFEDDDEEEDYGAGYLVQPVAQSEAVTAGRGGLDGGNDNGEEEEEVDDDEGEDEEEVDDDEDDVQVVPPPSSNHKRKRDDDDDDDDGDEDEDDDGEKNDDDDDVVSYTKSGLLSSHFRLPAYARRLAFTLKTQRFLSLVNHAFLIAFSPFLPFNPRSLQKSGKARATKESWKSALAHFNPPVKEKLSIGDAVKDLVLPFLPAKSLCRFKSVSKKWNQWIKNPFFIHSQSYYCRTTCGFFYQPPYGIPIFISLNPRAYGVASPLFTFVAEILDVRSSCNGLICGKNGFGDPNYYICNPVNKQGLCLPKSNLYHGPQSAPVLAFEPSLFNFSANYELICAIPSLDDEPVIRFEIFSSRSWTWRVVDTICSDLIGSELCGDGFYMNGFAYWETSCGQVLAFDLKYELYSLLPLPPNRRPEGVLTVSRGELCYVLPHEGGDDECLIEVYGGMDMSLKRSFSFRVGHLVVCDDDENEEGLSLRALPCLGDDTFAVLVGRNVLAYDARANRVRVLKVLGRKGDGKFVPYVNSLVPVRHHQLFSEISCVTMQRCPRPLCP